MKNMQKKTNGNYEARIRIRPWEKITYMTLGTKDKVVAQKRLDDIYRQMEMESEGLTTPRKMKEAGESSIDDLIRKYLSTIEAGVQYICQTESRLKRLCKDCGWKRLKDVDAVSFQQWRASHDNYTPKTKNHYLSSIHAFFTWLVDNGLAQANPLEKVKPLKARGHHAFKYRALKLDEIQSLFKLPHRSEIYHLAALTGLRHGEVGALQWGDVKLDANPPHLTARASTTKNGQEATIKLHADLVAMLESIRPAAARPVDEVFPYMPDNKTVRRDFQKAGIETDNERGEKASFHSFRKTFCTMLHNADIPQRIAQELMRHSDASLTNDIYADRGLFSLGTAIDSLPSLVSPPPPSLSPSKSGFSCQNVAHGGETEKIDASEKNADLLGKTKEIPGFEEFLLFKNWCTRMESNHHAIAGTRT